MIAIRSVEWSVWGGGGVVHNVNNEKGMLIVYLLSGWKDVTAFVFACLSNLISLASCTLH